MRPPPPCATSSPSWATTTRSSPSSGASSRTPCSDRGRTNVADVHDRDTGVLGPRFAHLRRLGLALHLRSARGGRVARRAPPSVAGSGREGARCRRRHRRVEPARRRARIRRDGAGSVGGDALEGACEGGGERRRADVRGRAGRGAAARTVRRDHGTPRRLDDARPGDGAPRLARRHGPRRTTRAVRRGLGRRHPGAAGEGSGRGRRCGASSAWRITITLRIPPMCSPSCRSLG